MHGPLAGQFRERAKRRAPARSSLRKDRMDALGWFFDRHNPAQVMVSENGEGSYAPYTRNVKSFLGGASVEGTVSSHPAAGHIATELRSSRRMSGPCPVILPATYAS